MPAAPLPPNEKERLGALQECMLLDTAPETPFDDLTQLAGQLCETPIALVSLVDANRQWFKSKVGMCVGETTRESAICAHAILSDGPFVIPDTTQDVRTADNPLVMGAPGVRFYAGIPLKTRGTRLSGRYA